MCEGKRERESQRERERHIVVERARESSSDTKGDREKKPRLVDFLKN